MGTEKEISLLNMCFHILSKWKIMMFAALIGGIFAAGISFLSSYSQYKNSQNTVSVNPIEEISLTEEEIKALEAKIAVIQEHEENIAEYDYYLENSIKVKLNPNRFYQGMLTYYLESENSENVTKAKLFCEGELLKESNYEELATMLTESTDAALIKEVVFIDSKLELEQETKEAFSVFVEHYNQDDCKFMLDYFEEQMLKMEEVLKVNGISVDVQKVSSNISTCSDYSLVGLSNDVKNKRSGAYESISAIETKMTEEQMVYYQTFYSENESDIEDETTNNALRKPHVNPKLAVLGMIIGVFLCLCFYGVIYLFDKRVHTKEELESLVSIPVYEYDAQEKIGYIDSALNSLKRVLTMKTLETPEMISQMVVNVAQKANAHKIYITGSKGNFEGKVFKHIKTLIAENGLVVMSSDSGLNDVQSLQQAVDCGYILFLEKCNVSKESDICAEIIKANTCGVKVLGVILEG